MRKVKDRFSKNKFCIACMIKNNGIKFEIDKVSIDYNKKIG